MSRQVISLSTVADGCAARKACVKIRVHMSLISGLITVAAMLLVTLTTAFAQAPGGAAARAIKNPVASTAASVTAGAATYKKYCAFCHGADAKGNGPLAPKDSNPPDLTDAMWVHGSTDGEIFTMITAGGGPTSKMIGFKGKMPDQDIWQVINYLRSLGPKTAAR